jgi:hypothetical protein
VSTTNFGKGCTAASSVLGGREEEHRAIQSEEERGGVVRFVAAALGLQRGRRKE